MKNEKDAAYLAELMVETGERMGKKVVALITDMDQPLGRYVGNALEVVEVLDVLRGEGPEDLRQLCLELAAWMFLLGEKVSTVGEGKTLSEKLIRSGEALEKFREMVALQGGDARVVDDPGRLPQAKQKTDVVSGKGGYVTAIQCERAGTACVILGGGRERKEDSVDPAVGFVLHKKVGDPISSGEPLCTIHYNSEALGSRAKAMLLESFEIGGAPPKHKRPLVHRVITGEKN
jgi:thymidine phosphorylase